MTEPPKPTFEEHKENLIDGFDAKSIFVNSSMYSIYMNGLVSDLKKKHLKKVMEHIGEASTGYVDEVDLLYGSHQIGDIELKFKPLESLFDKLFRLNVLWNKKWKPDGAPKVSLEECNEKVDDLFRTRLICRYLDGPKFLCDALAAFCEAEKIEHTFRSVITPLGYHAWHFYIKQELEDFNGEGPSHVWIEIQFTTQLAEVITSLTHFQYETARSGSAPSDHWQWDVYSDEFRPAYIGHGLHLLEGIIQEFRDDVLAKMKEEQGDAQ